MLLLVLSFQELLVDSILFWCDTISSNWFILFLLSIDWGGTYRCIRHYIIILSQSYAIHRPTKWSRLVHWYYITIGWWWWWCSATTTTLPVTTANGPTKYVNLPSSTPILLLVRVLLLVLILILIPHVPYNDSKLQLTVLRLLVMIRFL